MTAGEERPVPPLALGREPISVPVRDAIIKLGKTKDGATTDAVAEVTGRTTEWARRQLWRCTQHGIVEPERQGNGPRGRIVWRYVEPPSTTGPRRPTSAPVPTGSREEVPGGKGKTMSKDKETKKMLAAAKRAGATARKTSSGHIRIELGGKSVSISSTPSAGKRTVANEWAALKRMGILP